MELEVLRELQERGRFFWETGSSLRGTWSSYPSIDDAREAAREMLRDDRVARITVVTDTVPPRFVEWVKR